jgi:hypothetical protein
MNPINEIQNYFYVYGSQIDFLWRFQILITRQDKKHVLWNIVGARNFRFGPHFCLTDNAIKTDMGRIL